MKQQLFIGFLAAAAVFGQTKLDLSTQSKNIDFSQAASVRPFPSGAALPATCSVGQMYFLTTAPVGANECVATNTWTPIQGTTSSASSASGVISVQLNGTQLTVGPSCSISTPCVFRIGFTTYAMTAPATVLLTAGSGLTFIYIDGNGNLTVGVSAIGNPAVTCSGCVIAQGITQYPQTSIPLESWNATSGIWDSSGADAAALMSTAPALLAGTNITLTQSGGNITISTLAPLVSSGGSATGTYNPMDPTQWFRDHITVATGFTPGWDGWSYTGGCGVGHGSGATGFSLESVLPTVWASATGAGTSCYYIFPTTSTSSYGSGTYDYWSGGTPANLWVSATYASTDTNGTHYVGLSAGSVFIGCRQNGAGNWFAVISNGTTDIATADTGVPHNGNTHRLAVDNASGQPNVIRCSVDGGTPAAAFGTIPPQQFGWTYQFGAVSNGAATNFAPFEYTIFLQGLPRL